MCLNTKVAAFDAESRHDPGGNDLLALRVDRFAREDVVEEGGFELVRDSETYEPPREEL